jgi:DnaJ-class molecular chaperone
MPAIGRGRRGDQQVVLNVVIPRNLSPRQSELLEELRASLTPENLEEQRDESLLSKVKRALR